VGTASFTLLDRSPSLQPSHRIASSIPQPRHLKCTPSTRPRPSTSSADSASWPCRPRHRPPCSMLGYGTHSPIKCHPPLLTLRQPPMPRLKRTRPYMSSLWRSWQQTSRTRHCTSCGTQRSTMVPPQRQRIALRHLHLGTRPKLARVWAAWAVQRS
jgi:hypothetical protein